MSDLFKRTYRGYLVDHHSPAPPVITFENLDIAEYEQFYREANINNLMLYCKDHWGFSYFDTKIGVRHPALSVDWVGEQAKLLRSMGIEFNAYYCIEYDNTASRLHPEWATLQADGSHLRCTGRNAKWRIPCYMTGYRTYVLGQLEEIVSNYHPDSLFLDIFGKSLCYCPTCRSEFEHRNGCALPESPEGIANNAAMIIRFLDDCAEEFLDDILKKLKGIDPDLAVTINFSSHYRKSIRDKLDYHFTEPWAGNWLSAAYARATGTHPQLGPGDVSHIFDYLPATVYRQAASEIAAQGCRVFMYSEPQLPDGTLEHEESKRIGEAYREVEQFDHLLTDRRHIADICIIQSDASHAVGSDGKVVPNAIPRARAFNRHMQAVLGAMKSCEYSPYTWTVVPEENFLTMGLDNFKVVILPQVLVLSSALLDQLEKYIVSGGHVIATDETGLFDLNGKRLSDFVFSTRFGISLVRKRSEFKENVWGGFADFVKDLGPMGVADTTVPLNEESLEFSAHGTVIARFIPPAEILGPENWVNWGYPPPKRPATADLAVRMQIGKGTFTYYAFDLTTLANKQLNWPRSHISAVLGQLLEDPAIIFQTSTPDIVGYTAFKTSAGSILVHIVSHLPERNNGDAPPILPGNLMVPKKSEEIQAKLIHPNSQKLSVKEDSTYWVISLPLLEIHQIVEISEVRT